LTNLAETSFAVFDHPTDVVANESFEPSAFLQAPGPTLVLGFSSTGKSHFIQHLITKVPRYRNAQLRFPSEAENPKNPPFGTDDLIHGDLSISGEADHQVTRFPTLESHPILTRLIRGRTLGQAIVMVDSEEVLRKRIARRKVIGIGFGRDDDAKPYLPLSKIVQLNLFSLIDYYAIWIEALKAAEVPFQFVQSKGGAFHVLSEEEALRLLSHHHMRRLPRRIMRRLMWHVIWSCSASGFPKI